MPARYIVAVTDSPAAEAARSWAELHAEDNGWPVVAVHVTPDRHRERSDSTPVPHEGSVLLHGSIPAALAGFVRDEDVLVIGTDKTGFVHTRVFGSRGLQIVAATPSSVAVIPAVDLRFRSGVVAGIDRPHTAALIARTAAAEATARSETLQLIHSTFAGIIPAEIDANESVLDSAADAARQSWPELTVRTRTTPRPSAEALLDASRTAALLVLGPGKGDREALGTVLHDVLTNINCPVLIVREKTGPPPAR